MTVAERYSRNVMALSEEECDSLFSKRVTVVGCGGLGGYVIEMLSRAGVGYLRVIDGDVFEESNLNRQILSSMDVLGEEKVLVAARRVKSVNPLVTIEPHHELLDDGSAHRLLEGSDCVVDCLDNLESRFFLGRACQQMELPLVYGAIAGWYGQLCTVFPGDASYETVYNDASGTSEHTHLGNLGPTAACMAALQTAETLKVLLGRPGVVRNRLLMIDLLGGSFEDVELR